MKICVVGTGNFGKYTRDELVTAILAEHPAAEIVLQDSASQANGLSCDFVVYDEVSAPKPLQYELTALPSAYHDCPGFAKRGRRRGQRVREKSWCRK